MYMIHGFAFRPDGMGNMQPSQNQIQIWWVMIASVWCMAINKQKQQFLMLKLSWQQAMPSAV
jgi:hypothetical protein